MEQVIELFTSFEFIVGVASSMLVVILAYLVRPSVDGARQNWRDWQRRARAQRRHHEDGLVQEARRSERIALSHALHEVRSRFRAHTWLLLSFFMSSLGAFTFFFFIELDFALIIPRTLSLALLGIMMGAIVLFVFSLSDERAASRRTDLVLRILEDEAQSSDAVAPSDATPWTELLEQEEGPPDALGCQSPPQDQREDDLRQK